MQQPLDLLGFTVYAANSYFLTIFKQIKMPRPWLLLPKQHFHSHRDVPHKCTHCCTRWIKRWQNRDEWMDMQWMLWQNKQVTICSVCHILMFLKFFLLMSLVFFCNWWAFQRESGYFNKQLDPVRATHMSILVMTRRIYLSNNDMSQFGWRKKKVNLAQRFLWSGGSGDQVFMVLYHCSWFNCTTENCGQICIVFIVPAEPIPFTCFMVSLYPNPKQRILYRRHSCVTRCMWCASWFNL